jgi:hypothetical protein
MTVWCTVRNSEWDYDIDIPKIVTIDPECSVNVYGTMDRFSVTVNTLNFLRSATQHSVECDWGFDLAFILIDVYVFLIIESVRIFSFPE